MNRFRAGLLAVAALGFWVGSAASAIGARHAPDPGECGLPRDTPVIASFQANPARGIWNRLPALARSPELEEASGAAFVMVLGDVDAPAMVGGFGQTAPSKLANAVCVVLEDGPVLYYNVSRQGFHAP